MAQAMTEVPPGIGQRLVPWRARDLFLAAGAGIVLSILLIMPLAALTFSEQDQTPSAAVLAGFGFCVYVAMCLSGWFFAIRRKGATLRDAGFRPVPFSTLATMLPVTIGMMMLIGAIVSISTLIFGDVPNAQDQVVGGADSITFDDFIWLFLLATVGAPIAEEFIFRGLLYPVLRNRFPIAAAVLVSALAFAAMHLLPPLIPALLAMGVVLALLAERYQSLYPAMVVHALNNAVALIGLYLTIGQ